MIQVVAACLRDRDGHILLGKRPNGKTLAGYWEFPGGKVEPGESLEAALSRELKEELGLQLSTFSLLLEHQHQYDFGTVQFYLFSAQLQTEHNPKAYEHEELSFVSPENLSTLNLLPADIAILDELIAKLQE